MTVKLGEDCVVLWMNGKSYLLRDVARRGCLLRGYVVNGQWMLHVDGCKKVVQARSGRKVVESWPLATGLQIWEVPAVRTASLAWAPDIPYNKILHDAEKMTRKELVL
jgi:hypothetical protein